jgi:RNA polymerase sigma-70 factor (ECF subfamily)
LRAAALAYNAQLMASPPTPLDQMSDEQLVAAYRGGEGAAFERLLGRYHPELLPFLIRFVNDRAAAEDLFQETFLQVHQSIGTFDPSKRFRPWVFTIAANKARDHLRKHNRRQGGARIATVEDEDQATGRALIDLLEADLPLPEERVAGAETRQRVRATIAAMPDHLREVLLLAYFNQFSYKDIAAMLHIPLGTVKSRLHAAVGTFAELWKRGESTQG